MIDVQLVHKIGIIGYKNQAKRIISIIEKIPNFEIVKIFHPTKKIDDERGTNNFEELLLCDTIFILSPNHTHYEYIFKLMDKFSGYVFCEKPPVTNKTELEELEKISEQNKMRIFFNFNFRFSKINEILMNKKIGDIIYINIISTHGLAFKNEYKNSWRADGRNNKDNILETVAIHYLDLIMYHNDDINQSYYQGSNISKNGTSNDSCSVVLSSEKITASIFCSYASAKINEITIIGTDGYITIRENLEQIFYPRDIFDLEGFFTNPPKIYEDEFNFDKEYNISLEKSVNYFLDIVDNNKSIKLDYFNTSMKTTRLLLNLKKNE